MRDVTKRQMLLGTLRTNPIQVIDAASLEPSLSSLARAYIDAGVLPSGSTEDALHVAVATLLELDVLASWNYRHLANYSRELRFAVVNGQLGYVKTPRLLTPMELADESC